MKLYLYSLFKYLEMSLFSFNFLYIYDCVVFLWFFHGLELVIWENIIFNSEAALHFFL